MPPPSCSWCSPFVQLSTSSDWCLISIIHLIQNRLAVGGALLTYSDQLSYLILLCGLCAALFVLSPPLSFFPVPLYCLFRTDYSLLSNLCVHYACLFCEYPIPTIACLFLETSTYYISQDY
jgi:hypothetical protein